MDDFQHDFQGVHITNQHVVLYHPKWCVRVGPDAEFRDCRIDVQMSARGLILVRTRFIDCTIHFKRPLNNFPFTGAYFERCRIKGRLRGCEFGRRDDYANLPSFFPEAGIVDTDLSAAKLDGCRFMNCDLSTLRLPLWPCFTVPNHEAVREQALRLPWHGRTYIIPDCWEQEPPGTVAITEDARSICKRFGGTEAELRTVVEQIPGVIM